MIYSLGSGVILSYYPIFLRAHGLTQLQANGLLAVSFVIVFAMDIPTGAFADAAGRSASFVLGNALRSAGWLLYFFSSSFGPFLAAESTAAVGFTFANGALEAWAVDALDKAGFTGNKIGIFSRVTQLTGVTAMAGALIGTYSADYKFALPWAIGSAALMTTALAGLVLMKQEGSGVKRVGSLTARIRTRLVAGLAIGRKNKPVLMLAFASGVQIGAWAPYEMEWQKYFIDRLTVRIGTIGLMFCLFKVASVVGAELTRRLRLDAGVREYGIAISTGTSGAVLCFAGYFVGRPLLVLAFLCAANMCFGFGGPLVRTWANEEIDRDHRATLLSFFSTFGTVGGAIGLLLGGMLADAYGLGVAWEVGGLLVISSVPLILRAANFSARRKLTIAESKAHS